MWVLLVGESYCLSRLPARWRHSTSVVDAKSLAESVLLKRQARHRPSSGRPHLRDSLRCIIQTQAPMSFSRRVTSRAMPPPPATKMLALSGLSAARAASGCCRLLCAEFSISVKHQHQRQC